jgi:ketosteroid isomerase-like protein
MKKLIIIAIAILGLTALANGQQSDEEKAVSAAVETLKKAIVDADKDLLESIAADNLVYGHSNGRVQNKAEFIAEIVSKQPNDYVKIETTDQTIVITGNTAIVRHIYSAETISNGTPGQLKIGNMLVWKNQKGKWRLLARQAYKL